MPKFQRAIVEAIQPHKVDHKAQLLYGQLSKTGIPARRSLDEGGSKLFSPTKLIIKDSAIMINFLGPVLLPRSVPFDGTTLGPKFTPYRREVPGAGLFNPAKNNILSIISDADKGGGLEYV
ncbi:MAG: hypothetical protein HYW51_00505 [Candidatus Doudnabacteria bacterium]|nr:hypothetical protein [Candidatus Doudnabacteria bacterium]